MILVTPSWLADHLNDPNVRIADVRWYLFEKDKFGREEYARGHIPGAVFVDVDTDLAAHGATGPGRHPLPAPEHFAAAMRRAGISPATHVVAYDDRGGAVAARLWWLLRYCGHANVSLLDGGIGQWVAERRALETTPRVYAPGTFVAQPHPEMVVDKPRVNALRTDPRALVLDVRLGERYRGELEPIDPVAGHIPGAQNAPLAGNYLGATDFRFRAPAELRARFAALGAERAASIVPYCGSGINACAGVFALNLAGFENVLLYEGSWSDWSRDPSLPVATGAEP